MNILLTGATGFVGSHLAELLCKQGHQIYAPVRTLTKTRELPTSIHFIERNLTNLDESLLNDLPEKLDAVIHVAGLVHTYRNQDFFDVNQTVTKKIIQILSSRYENLKFVLISSLASYGPSRDSHGVKEEDPKKPVSSYGKSKQKAEEELSSAPEAWQKIIINPPMVIGPRDPAILDLFKMVKSRWAIVPGRSGLKKQYSFISIFDLVQVIAHSLHCPKSHAQYLPCYPKIVTMEEIIETIQREMNIPKVRKLCIPHAAIWLVSRVLKLLNIVCKQTARLTPDKYNELVQMSWTISSNKTESELSLSMKWNLEKIVKETFLDYKEREWI